MYQSFWLGPRAQPITTDTASASVCAFKLQWRQIVHSAANPQTEDGAEDKTLTFALCLVMMNLHLTFSKAR